jgi:hypothetical protein
MDAPAVFLRSDRVHDQMQHGNTIDLILVLPGPHQRTTPLHAQGDVERRDQGKTRFILAQHPALALVGFVFTL